uniref:A.tumefaciens DNA for TA region of Ti plasmid n=1 Tax=Agrobacterium tumefaciens TaxID=358 RepID=Q44449_AGRTU|nr:unnamed protein product [Agrobacterium tumefaciens]
MDDLGLVETVDRFCERVIVAVTDTPDGRLDACLCQAFGIPDRNVLNTAIRMMHKAAAMNGTPIMKCLLERIKDEARMCCPARPPADGATSKDVDDKGHVDEALPSRDIGEIRNPQPVWRRGFKLAVHPVKRTWSRLVRERRADRLSPNNTLQAHRPHKPSNGAAGGVEAFTLQLPPDLTNAIDPKILLEDATDLDLQADIAAGANRQRSTSKRLGDVLVIG